MNEKFKYIIALGLVFSGALAIAGGRSGGGGASTGDIDFTDECFAGTTPETTICFDAGNVEVTLTDDAVTGLWKFFTDIGGGPVAAGEIDSSGSSWRVMYPTVAGVQSSAEFTNTSAFIGLSADGGSVLINETDACLRGANENGTVCVSAAGVVTISATSLVLPNLTLPVTLSDGVNNNFIFFDDGTDVGFQIPNGSTLDVFDGTQDIIKLVDLGTTGGVFANVFFGTTGTIRMCNTQACDGQYLEVSAVDGQIELRGGTADIVLFHDGAQGIGTVEDIGTEAALNMSAWRPFTANGTQTIEDADGTDRATFADNGDATFAGNAIVTGGNLDFTATSASEFNCNGACDFADNISATGLQIPSTGTLVAGIRKTVTADTDLGGAITLTCTAETNFSITGVAAGDSCTVNTPAALAATDWIQCRTLTDNVALKYCTTGTTINPATMVYSITTIEY